ncbi:MAG: DNA polymerase III subunit epsilon [Alphaproteobacteria bacterium]|nr:DNA polymerase III subunit epsilon [Alphaproteobacteria bacterium]
MREIVLDTETTGLDPNSGDRVVEIGCVELVNHLPTGATKQWYLNPDRDMPEGAFRIHGLSAEFLSDKPRFGDIAGDFLDFIGDSPLIIHNADFDLKFLNAELRRIGKESLAQGRAIDTVVLARRKFPGAQANLDALCKRFGIDNSNRSMHGALLDSELLAEVYLELLGGREPGLALTETTGSAASGAKAARTPRPSRPHAPTEAEAEAHQAFLGRLSDPIWNQ